MSAPTVVAAVVAFAGAASVRVLTEAGADEAAPAEAPVQATAAPERSVPPALTLGTTANLPSPRELAAPPRARKQRSTPAPPPPAPPAATTAPASSGTPPAAPVPTQVAPAVPVQPPAAPRPVQQAPQPAPAPPESFDDSGPAPIGESFDDSGPSSPGSGG